MTDPKTPDEPTNPEDASTEATNAEPISQEPNSQEPTGTEASNAEPNGREGTGAEPQEASAHSVETGAPGAQPTANPYAPAGAASTGASRWRGKLGLGLGAAALALLKRIRYHAQRHALPRDWLTAADEVLGTWHAVKLTHSEIGA